MLKDVFLLLTFCDLYGECWIVDFDSYFKHFG